MVSTSGHTMMTPRRYLRLAIVAALLLVVITIYVTFFRHPPPDKLMEMNRRRGQDFAASFLGHDDDVKATHNKDKKTNRGANEEKGVDGDYDEDDKTMLKNKEDNDAVDDDEDVDADEAGPKKSGKNHVDGMVKGKAQWDAFLRDHKYTSVGVVFDKCEKPTAQLGTVILLADEEFGGVKTRTFYNLTLEEDFKGGTFNIEVKYNGQDLYDNWWEICEMEDDLEPEKRTFACPIRKGLNSLVKDKHIPGYLPEGRYLSKAWVKTQTGRLIACGFSDLTL